jgi:type IV pilus assembly protein PilA
MRYAQARWLKRNRFALGGTFAALMLLLGTECYAQSATAENPFADAWSRDLSKYPGLPVELSALVAKLQQRVQFPPARRESRLLPLLSRSTFSYVAIPNYADAADQTLKTFQQELGESSLLRDWWEHGEVAKSVHEVERSLDQFSQISQYLGDEIVISAVMKGDSPKFLAVSQMRKPGLKKFLEETIRSWGVAKPPVRVLGPEDLSAGSETNPSDQLVVLVRPDFFIAAADMATLREFNARLDASSREFESTAFGQRVVQEYRDGVTVLAAADLHRIVSQAWPAGTPSAAFRESGFADVQYLVWDHKTIDSKRVSQMEMSFTGPRHGAAAWLANSSPLGGLDFVSPKPAFAATVDLSDPAHIYDDAKEIARLAGSNTFASISSLERRLNLSLKDDLLSQLSGELTVELDLADAPQQFQWKAMLQVKDASHLQHTLNILTMPLSAGMQPVEDGGVTYYGFHIPTGKKPTEIDYTFADRYLIMGSSKDAVAEAVNVHKSGASLATSKSFLSELPPQSSLKASALFYQDPGAVAAMQLRPVAPGLAGALLRSSRNTEAVVGVYGDDTAIRQVSTSPALDVSGVLVVAAIAIPNLLRARIAANEAGAVGSIRTILTAEIAYSSSYPKKGFASNLAALGMDPRGPGAVPSPEHAGFLSESLANHACAEEGWCAKDGYHFKVSGVCQRQTCKNFVAIGTPVSASSGTRSFCATSDGVLHYTMEAPISSPPSVEECRQWPELQ